METLREAVLRLQPRIDLLHDCLGFGRFAEVTVTSDDFFLGRTREDIGFNHFLGHPSQAALDRTRQLFTRLDKRHQAEVIRSLHSHHIPPVRLGISETEPNGTGGARPASTERSHS